MGGGGGYAGSVENQFASTVHEGYATGRSLTPAAFVGCMRGLGCGPPQTFSAQVLRHPEEARTEEIALVARKPKACLLVQPDSRT